MCNRCRRQSPRSPDHGPAPPPASEPKETGWLTGVAERFLAAVVVYGYPALGATLALGALGAPVPTALATTVAGSLAAQGHLSWATAIGVAVLASLLGDLAGYGLGRSLTAHFIAQRGHLIGLTTRNRVRVEALFARWGGVTVFLTRTLVSHLSSVVSLLAGIHRYPLAAFLLFASLGRLAWTAAYFGLGFAVGTDLEPAAGFLGNLSLALLSLAAAAAATLGLWRQRSPPDHAR